MRFSLVGGTAAALLVLLLGPLGLQEAHGGQAGGKGRPLRRAASIQQTPIVEQSVGDPADLGMAPAASSQPTLAKYSGIMVLQPNTYSATRQHSVQRSRCSQLGSMISMLILFVSNDVLLLIKQNPLWGVTPP